MSKLVNANPETKETCGRVCHIEINKASSPGSSFGFFAFQPLIVVLFTQITRRKPLYYNGFMVAFETMSFSIFHKTNKPTVCISDGLELSLLGLTYYEHSEITVFIVDLEPRSIKSSVPENSMPIFSMTFCIFSLFIPA